MTEKVCLACGVTLSGRQLKYCADPVCKRERTRWAWILQTYNLTPEQYWAIWEYQGGKCGCCGKPFKEGAVPHIDHDHVSGVVRGIVHAYCNTRLIVRLRAWELAQKLADYLRRPPAVAALGYEVIAPGRVKKKRRARKKRS